MSDLPLLVEPVPALALLPPYVIGRPERGVDLVLDFNESLAAPPPLAPELCRYPPVRSELEGAVGALLGVAADRVAVTCGADDALQRVVQAMACPGRRVVLTLPSYGMLQRYTRLAGAELVELPWWSGELPVDALAAAAGDGPALVAVVSPNNPTGLAASAAAVAALIERLPRSLILVDQAYVDFVDPGYDLAELVLAQPNAVLVRTFSKAWGAAGLRVGFAAGDARVVDWLRRVGLPFPVSRPSAQAVAALLEAGPDRARVARVRAERSRLMDLLERLGVEVWRSQGSFVLARCADSARVFAGLAAFGIAVRNFGHRGGLEGCLRITLPGDDAAFARLAHALETILAPEAVLLDLDGVLADVSGSYRAAIVATAASFGVTVTAADISRAKARGHANNDWVLTRDLLAAAGVAAELDEVTRRFEALYQGEGGRPGLCARETPLLSAAELAALARRYPLAVVTGRPRRDAERFLAAHGMLASLRALVTMEDAASKPDPAPVRLALARLGVARAWLVGDTPDDLVAARAAGVLPVGVPAPGDDPDAARATLAAAGAALVLATTTALLEVLP